MFVLRSFQEIISDMLAKFIANSSVTDLNKGSVITTFLEAAATEDFRQYFAMLDIINNYSLNTTEGEELDSRAAEYGITRSAASKASGVVTISDDSFEKISSRIHAGLAGPLAGQNVIYVDDASNFPATGTIIIGRGNANVETVNYNSIVVGSIYDTINLASNLANDHAVNESVILSQGGDREIPAGTIVKIPATDFSEEVSYSVDSLQILLDGETELENVPVSALEEGTAANAPVGAINTFDSEPFSGAEVSNPFAFINGTDGETDNELRDRIKDTIQSLSKGTTRSILNSVVGIVDPDTNKRVTSANLIDSIDPTDIARLYIDDGTGFEADFDAQGFEEILRRSTGGEQFLQIDQFPVVKANVITINQEPFNIENNMTLTYEINGIEEQVIFANTDFDISGSGTANEVVAAINNKASLIEARTYGGGTYVEIRSRTNTNEVIQVTGGTANAVNILNFPIVPIETLYLYNFDEDELTLLSKDGTTAVSECDSVAPYDFSVGVTDLNINVDGETEIDGREADAGSSGTTLIDAGIDQFYPSTGMMVGKYIKFTTGNNIGQSVKIVSYDSGTTTIIVEGGVLSNSIDPGDLYSILKVTRIIFNNLSNEDFLTPSSATAEEVVNVINRQLQDVAYLASNNTKIQLISKIENSASSKIFVLGGTANTILQFPESEISGKDRDYILNRFNGQIELSTPLTSGNQVTAGSDYTRAFITSILPQLYNLSDGETLLIKVDQGVAQTITFLNADFSDIGNALASEVVTVINRDTLGIFAEVSEDNRIRIRTNTYDPDYSYIEITGGTANTVLGFEENSEKSALTPHKAFLISQNSSDYNFVEEDTLVVVLDQDAQNKTFNVVMDLDGTVTNPGSNPNTQFTATITDTGQQFAARFLNDEDLENFKVIWKSTVGGNNGQIRTVQSYNATTNLFTLDSALPGLIMPGDAFIVLPVTATNVATYMSNTVVSTISSLASVEPVVNSTKVQITTIEDGSDGAVNVPGGTGNGLEDILTQDSGVQSVNVESSLFKVGMTVIVSDSLGASTQRSIVTINIDTPTEDIYELVLDGAADLDAYTVARDAKVTRQEVLDFSETPSVGVDGYKYFTGLLKRVQNTVDGLDTDPTTYPGIRASGVQVEVLAPTVENVEFIIDVDLREGINISQVSDGVKSSVSSYVNGLGVGEDVILTEIVERVMGIDGIKDVRITSPEDNVSIADSEIARVSENDIVVG